MEVGAVKQAFNNEVILLKKKLSQAKIQIIHKLIRKSKQLLEKKAPDAIKEKLKRKAESAVNEVLIIKKTKPKDLAKFIITHKGDLKKFLNKPTVDNEKVCARLLLHKALQEKYKFIRDRFSDVPIQDLFMSRLERRKMKKEEKEKQNNKKKRKNNKVVSSSEGDWDIENIDVSNNIKLNNKNNQNIDDSDNDIVESNKDVLQSYNNDQKNDNNESVSDNEEFVSDNGPVSDDDDEVLSSNDVPHNENNESDSNEDDITHKKTKTALQDETETLNDSETESIYNTENSITLQSKKVKLCTERNNKIDVDAKKKEIPKTAEKKKRDVNKNKNFNEKIQQRTFKKDIDASIVDNKIVDPFFITSTGENYMSIFEPRGPDEIKVEHKQGNRKLRRAIMFGYTPKPKLIQDNNNYRNNNRFNNQNEYNKDNFRGKFNNREDFNSDRMSFNNDRKSYNNNLNDRKRYNVEKDEKPEKLHPSWEAKKKMSGILPFEGKKIVFD